MAHAGYINGAFVTGEGETLSVQDPSTEEVFESLPGLSTGQMESAVLAARKAFDSGVWSELPPQERAAMLRRFVAALNPKSEALKDLIMREAGCPRHSHSMMMQVDQPQRQGAAGVHRPAAQHEVERGGYPDQARRALRAPRAGDQAEGDLRQAQLGAVELGCRRSGRIHQGAAAQGQREGGKE